MIGAALVFDNPAVFDLPRARGILTAADAKCIDASLHPREGSHEVRVLNGCLGHTSDFFLEDFLFSGVLREELSTTGTWR
jgi:hypothetical protein